ncbi:MAG TPA: group II intron reverse transcriptase/maturase [Pseudonocardiaceae bacterium]|nr:group II intron reverse transcriptase/maturase [Pseudonocardiaceae bacterium]
MSSSTGWLGCSTSWPRTCAVAGIGRCRRGGCSSPSRASAGERRPLSIPSVRDRIVQAAVKIALEPVFEADMLACSYGFRPQRSAHDGLQVLIDESWRGRRWVVETDIANCFEAIAIEKLMQAVEERVCDRSVLKLLRLMLCAGVLHDGRVHRSATGTPQGGVISPLLANVYLHRIDRAWDVRQHGVLVRFADDALVMCHSREQAEAALARLTALLAELGLEPKAAKTRIVHLQVDGEGVEFLGFHHRLVRAQGRRGTGKGVVFLARWPTTRAMQHARDRIRELTDRRRVLLSVTWIVQDVNRFLRGWAGYFRYGNSARHFDKIMGYARMRIAIFIGKKHRRSRAFGWQVVAFQSPDYLGLINLDGTVAAPRPFRAWRDRPNAGGERRR